MAAHLHDHQEPTAGEPAAVQLLPLRATVAAGGDVEIEVRGHIGPAELRMWHLGDPVATVPVDQAGVVNLGPLPPGGYGIELVTGDRVLTRTAIDVAIDPRARLRYGFVASYPPERDPAGLVDNVRRLHLNGIQFYDWAYRHADLLGGGETYRDALDQLAGSSWSEG
jgi:dextranase